MEKTEEYKSPDHELHDIKQEIVADTYQMKIVEKQLNTIMVNLRKNEIVEKEISSLDEKTRVFDKIGRM